jgi:hypothetical protein
MEYKLQKNNKTGDIFWNTNHFTFFKTQKSTIIIHTN